MTTLTDLKRLALAATPGDNPLKHGVAAANWELCAALSPERVLALLAVVKAAEAMRERCRYEVAGQLHGAACAFDAALAELEQQT